MAYAKLVGVKSQISKFYIITSYFNNLSWRVSLYTKIFTYRTYFVGNFIEKLPLDNRLFHIDKEETIFTLSLSNT